MAYAFNDDKSKINISDRNWIPIQINDTEYVKSGSKLYYSRGTSGEVRIIGNLDFKTAPAGMVSYFAQLPDEIKPKGAWAGGFGGYRTSPVFYTHTLLARVVFELGQKGPNNNDISIKFIDAINSNNQYAIFEFDYFLMKDN